MLEKKAKENLSNKEGAHASGTETAEEKGSDVQCVILPTGHTGGTSAKIC